MRLETILVGLIVLFAAAFAGASYSTLRDMHRLLAQDAAACMPAHHARLEFYAQAIP